MKLTYQFLIAFIVCIASGIAFAAISTMFLSPAYGSDSILVIFCNIFAGIFAGGSIITGILLLMAIVS